MIGVNTRSVRFRTTMGAAVALALLVLVAGLIINRLVASQIADAADATLLEQATDRALLLDRGSEPEALVTVVGEEVVAAVLSPTGEVLASSGVSASGELAELPVGVSDAVLQVPHEGAVDEETLRAAVVEAGDGSVVIVASESEQAERTTGAVRAILLVSGPIVVLIGALVAWTVTGQALAPVHALRADLDSVLHLSEASRVGEPGTGDEIESLAVTTNSLLERLEGHSSARRRFVADASHELKSPIANALAIVETATEPAQRAVAAKLTGELYRLQDLVDDLLFLAKTDEGAPSNNTVFDLDDVVFDEAERVAIRTEKAIDAAGVQPAQVHADRSEVARAIRNLLENAVRHAHRRVAIGVEPDGAERWVVVVADDGPGIAIGDRAHVFERFARLDDDRTRPDGGTGLGLSIVASIADRSGGSVQVTGPEEAGARFELALPRHDR